MTYNELPHGTLLIGDKNVWFVFVDDNGRRWEIKLLLPSGRPWVQASPCGLHSDTTVSQRVVVLNEILERIMNGKT